MARQAVKWYIMKHIVLTFSEHLLRELEHIFCSINIEAVTVCKIRELNDGNPHGDRNVNPARILCDSVKVSVHLMVPEDCVDYIVTQIRIACEGAALASTAIVILGVERDAQCYF